MRNDKKISNHFTNMISNHINTFDIATECKWRNSLLSQYNKLPSYAYWREIDIMYSTIDERIQWWDSINSQVTVKTRRIINEALRRLSLLKSKC